MQRPAQHSHSPQHAFGYLNARLREGLTVVSRRSVLKASLAGIAGLSLPDLLWARTKAAEAGQPIPGNKSVILLWMTGGPSHIDTWDVKPHAPRKSADHSRPSAQNCPACCCVNICPSKPP